MDKRPIFIHSLFRAGSTYLFMVFRNSTTPYLCYQEALHERAWFAKNDPSLLLEGLGPAEMRVNRHPVMDSPYFQELFDIWPAWQETIEASSIYTSYFAPPKSEIGVSYWKSLIDASESRPVFQECRTSGRIGAIKAELGGYHVYLWRNPWDQWWSYKIKDYFETANQLIIRAPHAPAAVVLLRKHLSIEDRVPENLAEAFAYYSSRPLSSEESYLIFYMLWCFGLFEGVTHADLILNIDRLSDSPEYQKEIQSKLQRSAISEIYFSDCRVPQAHYLKQDLAFFEPLEELVHQWLLASGWSPEQLGHIQELRRRNAPAVWSSPLASFIPNDLAEQASRARAIARRFQTSLAKNSSSAWAEKLMMAESRLFSLHEDLLAIRNSKSWKLTAPLRKTVQLSQRLRGFAKSVVWRMVKI